MIDISKGRYWDLPWSLVDGCTPCSPGCDHCWSAAMAHRFNKRLDTGELLTDFTGVFGGYTQTHPERLNIPLKRKKPAVYAIWNDLFHEDVPFSFIDEVFQIIGFGAIHHKFLILSKRPQKMAEYFKRLQTVASHPRDPFPNIWSGLTVCNQQEADEKIPIFLEVPGKKFLSIEPMLSEISLRWIAGWNGMATKPRPSSTNELDGLRLVDAVILGGETGPGARPMNPEWAQSIKNQCQAAGVPFFFKSWGNYFDKGVKKRDLSTDIRILDGRTHDALPWTKEAV